VRNTSSALHALMPATLNPFVALTEEIYELSDQKEHKLPSVVFTVIIAVGETVIIKVPGFRFVEGRIEIPIKPNRLPQGEAWFKVVSPTTQLLKAIHEAIFLSSDWYTRWPDLAPLAPLDLRSADLNCVGPHEIARAPKATIRTLL
jgi:hypothetical protein